MNVVELLKKGKTMDQTSMLISNIYATLLVVGGIYGFVTVQSLTSLIVGTLSGIIIFLATKIGEKKPKQGYLFIAAVSLVLALFFSLKLAANPSLIPNGLMLVLSTTTFVIVGLNYLKKRGKK